MTIKQLDEINDRRTKKRAAYSELKAEYLRAVDAVKQMPVNETLLQLTPKIEALFDEEKRLIEIDGLITEHEEEITLLENRITEAENQIKRGRRALLLPAAKRSIFPETFYSSQKVVSSISAENSAAQSQDRTTFTQNNAEVSAASNSIYSGSSSAVAEQSIPLTAKGSRPFLESNEVIDVSFLDSYRLPSGAARKAKKRLIKARHRLTELSGQHKILETKVGDELKRRNAEDIGSAVEKTTETVQLLRRSQGIAQRLSELTSQFKDLHRVNVFLMQNQSLPVWLTVLIALICAIGAVPLGILLFEQSGAKVFENNIPIPWVLLGLAAAGASIGFKILTERSYSRKLEENQRQLGIISTQIEQVKQEGISVNSRLAALQGSSAAVSIGKSIELRLQEAQQELLQLEKLQPVETERRQNTEELKKAEQRYEHYKQAAANASKRWNEWLKNAGLPESWSPAKLRELLAQCNAASSMKKELDLRYEAMNQRIRDMKILTERIDRIVLESGLIFEDGVSYVDILSQLRSKITENEIVLNKKNKLRSRLPEFYKMRKKVTADLRKINREEDDILRPFGVKTADALRSLYKKTQKHRQLVQQEQSVQRELDAAAGTFCTEAEIAALLPRIAHSKTADSDERTEELPPLKNLIANISAKIETLSAIQREELEQRGKLTEQLQKITEDKTALEKQRDLSVIEEKIRLAQHEWQTYAVCGKMLDTIRSTYEKERQPRTLAEASEFLRKLTDGKYRRIWSPLSEETLLVDDESGNTFDAAWLSRGTREQMFIAIRLALASAFAQHGSILPLIMDDVLVNFDSKRSMAAAKVLLDFAQSGRQVFLLTCHEHVCRIFQKLDVPVRILPPVDEPSKGMKVLLPRSILEKRETERRKKIAALAAERNRQMVEDEVAQREDKIRQETLHRAEVQRLIEQMQQQATAEKVVQASGTSAVR
ncbi:hypothetical protein FACS1894214_2980 [Planctomycetales bacterium]|nr:hypothetical protein FACS1894214_2980 [Planctomycetales bacterium]